MEAEEELNDMGVFVEKKDRLSRRKKMPNRFSSRNATLRQGDSTSSDIDQDLFKNWSNAKLMIAGFAFLILNVLFSRYVM